MSQDFANGRSRLGARTEGLVSFQERGPARRAAPSPRDPRSLRAVIYSRLAGGPPGELTSGKLRSPSAPPARGEKRGPAHVPAASQARRWGRRPAPRSAPPPRAAGAAPCRGDGAAPRQAATWAGGRRPGPRGRGKALRAGGAGAAHPPPFPSAAASRRGGTCRPPLAHLPQAAEGAPAGGRPEPAWLRRRRAGRPGGSGRRARHPRELQVSAPAGGAGSGPVPAPERGFWGRLSPTAKNGQEARCEVRCVSFDKLVWKNSKKNLLNRHNHKSANSSFYRPYLLDCNFYLARITINFSAFQDVFICG